MNSNMTRNTDSNNIKWLGVVRMVILLGLFTTRAPQAIWTGYSASTNSIIHLILSFEFFRIFNSSFGTSTTGRCFAFGGFAVFSCTVIITFCTSSKITIFGHRMLVKFRNWFSFFANTAGFCYDCLRHNQLLYSWLRLKPVVALTAVGLLYYIGNSWNINQILKLNKVA